VKLTTYVNYGGNCEEAFKFYEQHLGGTITFVQKHSNMPGPANPQIGPEWKDKVLHARITLGGTELLGADIPKTEPMRSAYLTLSFDNTPEAERVYKMLSEDGEIFMPIAETFFAHRFAMLRDRFGTSWMLLHQKAPEAS
jgi:PhnB protein